MRNLAGGLAKIMTAAAIVIVRVVCACQFLSMEANGKVKSVKQVGSGG